MSATSLKSPIHWIVFKLLIRLQISLKILTNMDLFIFLQIVSFASLSTIMLRMRRILGSAYLLLQLVGSQSIYDEEEVKVVYIVTFTTFTTLLKWRCLRQNFLVSFWVFPIGLLVNKLFIIHYSISFQGGELEDIWYGDHSDFPGYSDAQVSNKKSLSWSSSQSSLSRLSSVLWCPGFPFSSYLIHPLLSEILNFLSVWTFLSNFQTSPFYPFYSLFEQQSKYMLCSGFDDLIFFMIEIYQ